MSEYIRETKEEKGIYEFWCPGCNCHHFVKPSIWKIDTKTNTLSPSVLVKTPRPKGMKICHTFVRNGQIQYLNDCTHKLAGKTIPMEPLK